MEKYIEFVKIHLPDIINFVLEAALFISLFIAKYQGKNTMLLTRKFFAEKTKAVDDTHTETRKDFSDTRQEFTEMKKRMTELEAENAAFKKRLDNSDSAILAMCGRADNITDEEKAGE